MHMIELLEFFVAPISDSQMTQMAILAVLLLILMDWLLGTATALITHSYDSTVARKGIAHKAGELCFVLLAILVDGCIGAGLDLGITSPVLLGTCVYVIVMEVGSILETIGTLNPDLADSPLFRLLASMQEHRIKETTEQEVK